MIDGELIGDPLPPEGRRDWQPSEAELLPPRGQQFVRNYQWLMYTVADLREQLAVATSQPPLDEVIVTPEKMARYKGTPTYFVAAGDSFKARWES